MTDRFRGVIAPLLTPCNDDFSPAVDLYLDHAAQCLAQGAHYLSPFGTTGEALSHSVAERMDVLEALLSSGTARPDQLMPGTGLCSLPETVDLTRHAAGLGCAAVMVLPPFFYVAAGDEGLYRYFSTLIERVGANVPKICLYHIPQNTGIGISPALAARLNRAFPDHVVAYKDSSGDFANTEAVIRAAPGLSVFPGSESLMPRAMALGGAGCISASCNSNMAAIRRLYDLIVADDADGAAAQTPAIDAHRQAVQAAGLIPGLKALKARQTGVARWLNLRPPLLPADPGLADALIATTGAAQPT